jgi:hypothetical protein
MDPVQTRWGLDDISSSSSLEPANNVRAVSIEGPVTPIVGDQLGQLASGTYDVTYVRHELRNLVGYRAMELVMWFCVISPGSAFGVHVPKYYNVGNADPAETSANTFKVGFKSELYRDYTRLVDERPRGRNSIWINGFKDKIFKADIRFFYRDRKQQPISKSAPCSIIEHLLEKVT